jgi:hypothetical protein
MARERGKQKITHAELSLLLKREAYTLRQDASEAHGGVHTHEYVISSEYVVATAFENLADRLMGLR